MGRSVSYPSAAQVITFATMESTFADCECGAEVDTSFRGTCDSCGREVEAVGDDFDELIEDFQQHLKSLFPSVEPADSWIDNEDHVLAENKLARFGMSEYCGLVSYWIVPKEYSGPKGEFYYSSDRFIEPMSKRWIASISDKFVAAFGELTKVGSMSNGEGVYRRIDK